MGLWERQKEREREGGQRSGHHSTRVVVGGGVGGGSGWLPYTSPPMVGWSFINHLVLTYTDGGGGGGWLMHGLVCVSHELHTSPVSRSWELTESCYKNYTSASCYEGNGKHSVVMSIMKHDPGFSKSLYIPYTLKVLIIFSLHHSYIFIIVILKSSLF